MSSGPTPGDFKLLSLVPTPKNDRQSPAEFLRELADKVETNTLFETQNVAVHDVVVCFHTAYDDSSYTTLRSNVPSYLMRIGILDTCKHDEYHNSDVTERA